MKNDLYYMNLAYLEAKKAFDCGEVPIGAVIVKNDTVISKGYNKREFSNNVLDHAELIAIKKACGKLKNWRLIDCTIYVTAFPCPMCASAINQARISKIVYGTVTNAADFNTSLSILKSNNYGIPVDISNPILEDSCGKLIHDFFKEKRS